jgi:hypothetical protein
VEIPQLARSIESSTLDPNALQSSDSFQFGFQYRKCFGFRKARLKGSRLEVEMSPGCRQSRVGEGLPGCNLKSAGKIF